MRPTKQEREEERVEDNDVPSECQVRFRNGEPVPIHEGAAHYARRAFPVYSESMRGFVIGIGYDCLVRVARNGEQWFVELLPQRASVARDPGHQHVLKSVRLRDGTMVWQCVGCGSECD